MHLLILFILAIGICGEEMISYENYKVYQIKPSNKKQLGIIRKLKNNRKLDFWTPVHKFSKPVKIMAPPTAQKELENLLKQNNIPFKITVNNVESILAAERREQHRHSNRSFGRITFDKYYKYSEIEAYLNELSKFDVVKLEQYGLSYEKRKLLLVRICADNKYQRPIIFMDGGMHAREWISVAQVLYVIYSLVEQPKNKDLIDTAEWILVPVVNPDGYEFSHVKDRLWRKTRSKGRMCIGTDANRNFPIAWDKLGSNKDECSDQYSGSGPLSEPETKSLSKVLKKYRNRIKLYVSFHSPDQSIVYPWGNSPVEPLNALQLHDIAFTIQKAIFDMNGTQYKIGSSYNLIDSVAGCSRDWVYGVLGVKLAYEVDLPPGDKGNEYHIAPQKISGVVKEMFDGLRLFHLEVRSSAEKIDFLIFKKFWICLYVLVVGIYVTGT